MNKIVEGYEYVQTAKKNITNLIEKSDKVEVDLIDIKRLLERASLSLKGIYLNILAEEAGIDIDVKAEEYLARSGGERMNIDVLKADIDILNCELHATHDPAAEARIKEMIDERQRIIGGHEA